MPKKMVRKDYNEEQRLYEERKKLEAEYMNEEGAFFRFIKNKRTLFGFIALVAVVSLIGIGREYMKITKQQDEQALLMQSQPNNSLAPAQNSEEEQKRQEEQERKEEEAEMKKLQENFKPFANDATPDVHGIGGHGPVETPHNEPPKPEPTVTPPPVSTPTPEQPAKEKPVFELKGIAQQNGVVFCYVSDGNRTVRLEEGDDLQGLTLERIGTNYIVLLNEATGEREMVNN